MVGKKRKGDEEAMVPVPKTAPAAPETRRREKSSLGDLCCCFCGCKNSQDVEWGTTPQACFACEDRALLLRPALTIAYLVTLYTEGAAAEDGGFFKEDFDEATQAVEADVANFVPKSMVQTQECYGFQIFQDFGLLTDNELGPLLGALPETKKKKKKDVTIPWQGPETLSHYNLVDLADLSYESSVGLRKVRMYYESSAERSKIFLSPKTQLVESQGDHVFKHVANSCIAARPDGLTPTAGRPKTISQLKVDVMQAQLDMETPAAEEKDKEEDGIVDTEPDGSKAGKKRAAGIGLVAAAKKVSKGKGGGKGSKVPNPRSPVRSVPSTQPSQASQPSQPAKASVSSTAERAETLSQSTAGNAKGTRAALAKFEGDEDMKTVAAFQLSNNSHAPLKSLEGLVVIDFLLGEKDQKHLTNILNGAKKIMETLEKKGQQHELNLLKDRIEICEHGFALGYNNLSTMKPSVMQAHIMSTKKQWEKYPVSLQLGIVARHAQASLEKVLLSKKKESECWKEAAVELVTFFQFDVEQMLTLDATSFDEHFDGHAPTWQTGIMMMSVSALELAEDSLSSIKLEDDDGLTAEAAQTKIAELQSIATDFGSKLRALFTHPAWIELLNLQEKAADVHILVCKHLYRHIEAMSSLFTSWIDTPLVPVAEAFEQILAMAKAILHLHAWNPESDAGFDALKPTVPGDVFDFMRCDKQFERSLSKILQDGWWKAQVAEIAKTAGSRPLVQVQWRELNTLLQDISPEQATAQHLSRVAELFETVGKGMREKEMGSVGGKCKDLVVGVVQKLLKSEATALDMTQLSKQADVVMSLLRRFGHEPQIPTLVDDFASWLEGTTNQRQLATLIAHMEKCARGSIDFKAIKQLVPGVGKDKEQSYAVAADEATKLCEAACNFMVKGLLTVSDQVNTSAADDAACTQRTADVRLNLAILNGVSKLVKDLVSDENPGRDAFTAYINSCISLGLAGAFHAKEINLLEGLGPDAETRNQADVEAKRLRQAKTARAKCVASEATCVAAQQKLLPFVKAEDGSALHSLVTLKLWESYHYRNNEVYHDCVLHLLSGHETNCTTSAATVVGLCRDRQQGGKEWWRRDLAPGATMDDVFMAAAANTKGVDGNQLKKEVEVLAKDVAKVQADIKFFDDGDSQDIKAKCERVVEVLNDLCAGGLKQAKAFTMEVLLIMVMGRLRKEPTDSNKESVRNLVTLYNVQFAGNCFGVAADDLNPALWAQASAV